MIEILIVEDSLIEAELLRRALSRAGYHLAIARDGQAGLEAVRAQKPALVVSDIRMPYLSGYELCKKIKYDPDLWNIPVILLTMLSEPEDIMEAINSGADSYLIKPFNEAMLLERIRSLLATPIRMRRSDERRREQVEYNGRTHTITGGSQQILHLLLSAYENTLVQNRELVSIQNRLNLLNESLEEEVRSRTAQLAASEVKFRSMFEGSSDGILLIEAETGIIVDANPVMSELLGMSREAFCGKQVWEVELLSPIASDGESFGKLKENLRRENLPLVSASGNKLSVELACNVYLAGATPYIQCSLRDITEYRKTRIALQLFRTLIDHSNDAIVVYDPETYEILDMNGKGCRDLGYSPEEIRGFRISDIDPGFRSENRIVEDLRHQGSALFESVHRRRDGSLFPVEVSVRNIELDRNYGLAVVRDITERKKSELALLRANRALKALSACNTVLVHAENEAGLLDEMCQVIVKQGGYHFAWIGQVMHDEKMSLQPLAHAGHEEGYLGIIPGISWGDSLLGLGPSGRAVRSGIPQVSRDIATDPSYSPWREEALKRGYVSSISLPLMKRDGSIFGILAVFSSESDAFDEEETGLLVELAADLSFGITTMHMRIERDKAVEGERVQAFRLRQSLEETIAAIALTLEKRDPYTAGHQQRVAKLSAAIAEEMQLPEDMVQGIHFGALIHDIGKVYVPAEILNRPGKLSEIEFGLIKSHPEVGYEIVRDIHFPWPVAQMVRSHHERLNGSGYPRGLGAEEIGLETRILSVADLVEAMAAHRPYRAARGLDEARREILRGRGTEYDEKAVDACISVLDKGFSFNS